MADTFDNTFVVSMYGKGRGCASLRGCPLVSKKFIYEKNTSFILSGT